MSSLVFKQPVCWWVLSSLLIGCLPWGIPELYPLQGKVGPCCQNRALQESSSWWIFPQYLHHHVLIPTVSHSHLLPPQEILQDQQVGLAQAPAKSLLWPWDLVCRLQEWHLCLPQPCGASALRICWPSEQMLWGWGWGGSSSHCQTPKLERLTWGSELSLLWKNFCNKIVLQCVGQSPGWCGIGVYH